MPKTISFFAAPLSVAGDAADAAAVHGFPFGAFETQVAAAFFLGVGEVPRVVGTEENNQKADVGLLFQRLLNGVRPVEKLGIGQSGTLLT